MHQAVAAKGERDVPLAIEMRGAFPILAAAGVLVDFKRRLDRLPRAAFLRRALEAKLSRGSRQGERQCHLLDKDRSRIPQIPESSFVYGSLRVEQRQPHANSALAGIEIDPALDEEELGAALPDVAFQVDRRTEGPTLDNVNTADGRLALAAVARNDDQSAGCVERRALTGNALEWKASAGTQLECSYAGVDDDRVALLRHGQLPSGGDSVGGSRLKEKLCTAGIDVDLRIDEEPPHRVVRPAVQHPRLDGATRAVAIDDHPSVTLVRRTAGERHAEGHWHTASRVHRIGAVRFRQHRNTRHDEFGSKWAVDQRGQSIVIQPSNMNA